MGNFLYLIIGRSAYRGEEGEYERAEPKRRASEEYTRESPLIKNLLVEKGHAVGEIGERLDGARGGDREEGGERAG